LSRSKALDWIADFSPRDNACKLGDLLGWIDYPNPYSAALCKS
jgi:hypothetical protein